MGQVDYIGNRTFEPDKRVMCQIITKRSTSDGGSSFIAPINILSDVFRVDGKREVKVRVDNSWYNPMNGDILFPIQGASEENVEYYNSSASDWGFSQVYVDINNMKRTQTASAPLIVRSYSGKEVTLGSFVELSAPYALALPKLKEGEERGEDSYISANLAHVICTGFEVVLGDQIAAIFGVKKTRVTLGFESQSFDKTFKDKEKIEVDASVELFDLINRHIATGRSMRYLESFKVDKRNNEVVWHIQVTYAETLTDFSANLDNVMYTNEDDVLEYIDESRDGFEGNFYAVVYFQDQVRYYYKYDDGGISMGTMGLAVNDMSKATSPIGRTIAITDFADQTYDEVTHFLNPEGKKALLDKLTEVLEPQRTPNFYGSSYKVSYRARFRSIGSFGGYAGSGFPELNSNITVRDNSGYSIGSKVREIDFVQKTIAIGWNDDIKL